MGYIYSAPWKTEKRIDGEPYYIVSRYIVAWGRLTTPPYNGKSRSRMVIKFRVRIATGMGVNPVIVSVARAGLDSDIEYARSLDTGDMVMFMGTWSETPFKDRKTGEIVKNREIFCDAFFPSTRDFPTEVLDGFRDSRRQSEKEPDFYEDNAATDNGNDIDEFEFFDNDIEFG